MRKEILLTLKNNEDLNELVRRARRIEHVHNDSPVVSYVGRAVSESPMTSEVHQLSERLSALEASINRVTFHGHGYRGQYESRGRGYSTEHTREDVQRRGNHRWQNGARGNVANPGPRVEMFATPAGMWDTSTVNVL